MAVAIGASCAFLTPIGHQNNLLVMGPGGYRFGDYWRMGLPLEILILAVSLPLLAHFLAVYRVAFITVSRLKTSMAFPFKTKSTPKSSLFSETGGLYALGSWTPFAPC